MKRNTLGSLVSLVLISQLAMAYEQPSVNLGATSFMDGGPPSGPGWYFQEYIQYYTTDTLTDVPFPSQDITVWASLNQLVYQSDQELLLGGKWGITAILPLVYIDSEVPQVPDNSGGVGDLLVGPFLQWGPIMGEKGPIFMHRVELSVILPTGKYDDTKGLNPGSNFISFNPYWAATWFATPKLTASTRIHYLWNAENSDTDIQAGQAVHANLTASYEVIPKQLRIGINSYGLKQITDSDGAGSLGKEQVYAIGPGALFSFSPETHLFLNAYFEFDAKNRPEGERYNIRLVHHF
jgi:anthranilate 1,2-dioxygenase (deaminating, decarboxylating) large subunit